MAKIYFEVNSSSIVVSVTNALPNTENEVIEREEGTVIDPYDMVGRNISELNMDPRPNRQPGTIIPTSPSKRWFDRLKIAKAELDMVTSLELSGQLEQAQSNYNNLRSRFSSEYEPGDSILNPTGLEDSPE